MNSAYQRPIARLLVARLAEPTPKWLNILVGPRQVGKTTLVRQVLEGRPAGSARFVAADDSLLRPRGLAVDDVEWLVRQWQEAEALALRWQQSRHPVAEQLPFVLVIDEVQGLKNWAPTVKGLWDGAVARGAGLHVVLLGSAPLLVTKGLSEALTGRYEAIVVPHWSFTEMSDGFGFDLAQYVYFGGYPGGAALVGDEARWREYVQRSLIEPSIERDVLALARVDKPALLRRLFELGCEFSSQLLALSTVSATLEQGHTLTLAHHLSLLSQAGLLCGLNKYASNGVRQRAAAPKFQVLNNALLSAQHNHDFAAAQADHSHWGRLVESAVGAHLLNTADASLQVHYWRESPHEVDFVIERHGRLAAIEVKSQGRLGSLRGLDTFVARHPGTTRLVVGSPELPLSEFLHRPAVSWLA